MVRAAAPSLAGVAQVVRWHHERHDGKGYPDGLLGPVIPLEARIVSVVDAFDAMTSDRCYRPATSVASAVAELRQHAGTQWDAECVELLVGELAGSLFA